MVLKNGFAENVRQNKFLVGYVVLIVLVAVGFLYMERLTMRIEHEGMLRAHENCVTNNETRRVIGAVLDELAEPRPDDEPGDFKRRQDMRERVDRFLAVEECPPRPGLPDHRH